MPDLFFGRPVGHSRSFSLRPTYDNPSDYSRQFSIDPLGLNSLSQTGDCRENREIQRSKPI